MDRSRWSSGLHGLLLWMHELTGFQWIISERCLPRGVAQSYLARSEKYDAAGVTGRGTIERGVTGRVLTEYGMNFNASVVNGTPRMLSRSLLLHELSLLVPVSSTWTITPSTCWIDSECCLEASSHYCSCWWSNDKRETQAGRALPLGGLGPMAWACILDILACILVTLG